MNHVWDNLDKTTAAEARGVLARLQLLSYASTSALWGTTKLSSRHAESRRPNGPVETLYEEFVGKFSPAIIAGDAERVRSLVVAAETAIRQYKGQYRAEMELPTDDDVAMERVVEVYEGVCPVEVVRRLASNVSIGWVKSARRKHRRDPETGHPLEGWRGWDDERRTKEIDKAQHQGMSLRGFAKACGAPLASLHRQWPRAS